MLLILLLTSCFALVATGAMAQSENTVKNVSVMNLDYTVKEAPKSELGTVVSAVLDVLSDKTTTEEPGYADALRASVITALGNVRRFSVSDGRQVSPTDNTNFIVDGTINYISITRELKVTSDKKDKVPQYYAQIGLTLHLKDPATAHGLQEGVHFDVYAIGNIGGKETRKEIGRLKVKSIEGDEVSLCKVTSGGKDIKAAIDAQQQLLIISTD